MTLGELIKQYRVSEKISMEEFAKRAGLSKQYISILERNYNPSSKRAPVPTLETVLSVAKAMERDFDDVFVLLDQNQKIKLPAVYDEEQLDRELIDRLCRLTPEELQKVDAFVQGILTSHSE